jgi:hypothetical protein
MMLGALDGAAGLEAPGEPVAVEAADLRYVAAEREETVIRGRPWVPFKRLATVEKGTRLVVQGRVSSRDDKGCRGEPWYAVYPFGYVCSRDVRPAEQAPSDLAAIPLDPKRRVPFDYAFVREDGVAMYADYGALEDAVPTRTLTKGMSLAVERTLEFNGLRFARTTNGEYVPRTGIRWGGQGSKWSGVLIDGVHRGPSFAWTTKAGVRVRETPSASGKRVAKLQRRERVPLLEFEGKRRKDRWYRIAEDRWVSAKDLNEVVFIAPPRGVLTEAQRRTGNDQWIDVDLGEQVLVAYRGARPVYATLVSSGRGNPTPLGNYPIWAKVTSLDMSNQDYEDNPYLVQGVPWVMLFQGHNALHGAYWHDSFGRRKSHGCVNLAPLDARFLFEWTSLAMPEGWTGYLPAELDRSIVVHVRDTSRGLGNEFTQQRRIGPPDREKEEELRLAAEERRSQEQVAAAEAGNFLPHPANTPAPTGAGRIEPPPLPAFSGPPEPG